MVNGFLSDEFFHLVGRGHHDEHERNYGILKLILRDEAVLYPNAIPGESRTSVKVDLTKSLASGDLIVPTITCYCDIPIANLAFHAKKYGHFGVSFHRDFLIRRGARPVTYIPMFSDDFSSAHGKTLLKDLQAIYGAFRTQLVDPARERMDDDRRRTLGRAPKSTDGIFDALDTVLTFYLLAFVKPYNSQLPIDHLDYYYSEREWRMTNYLRFLPAEVARVIVAREYAGRLAADMPQYRDKIFVIE
jgi:abortive phage resistance protein AbiGi (putative antitoxin)